MTDTPYLFVYGTLMSAGRDDLGRPMRARLAEAGCSLGAATMRGRLYDLGAYPGLVDGADASDVVHGEVFELDDAAATFAWLDGYESIVPGDPDASEYARLIRSVVLASGGAIDAWVYLYLRSVERGLLRPAGRWLVAD